MTDFSEWAAFAGLAGNQALSVEERLSSALRAIELLEVVLGEARQQTVQVMMGVPEDAPQAWKDLVEALTLMSKGQANEISPTHCEHDEMWVMADPSKFTEEERVKLESLGFFEDEDERSFRSFRFGSA